MYRKSALDDLPKKLFEICSYDWIVNICVARQSLIGFLEEPLSVYRLHSSGVWSQTPHIEKLREQLELIPAYNELTNNVFQEDFGMLAKRLQHTIAASHVAKVVEDVSQPVVQALPRLIDYVPPVLMTIIRAVMPPKIKRYFVTKIQGGGV